MCTATLPVLGNATLRLSVACDLSAVRPAVVSVCEFLDQQGLNDQELLSCELALVEACNNAVENAGNSGRQRPVEIVASCRRDIVELRVEDHTAGFVWPEHAQLPSSLSERGRGVFLIQSLMEKTRYFPGPDQNTLVMICRRQEGVAPAAGRRASALAKAEACALRPCGKHDELRLRSESLTAILDCSSELTRTNDLKGFSQRLLKDLLRIIGADWFVLRLDDPEGRLVVFASSSRDCPMAPLTLGTPAAGSVELQASLDRKDVLFDDCRLEENSDPLACVQLASHGVVCPVLFGDTLVGTLAVGRGARRPPFTHDQRAVVRTFADYLAIPVEHSRLHEEMVKNRVLAHELEIARDIQRGLLPRVLPQPAGFSLAGYCESARQIGGDFYDVVPLSKTSLLIVVADVMGRGVPAAMFASNLRSRFLSMLQWASQPAEMLSRLNRLMFDRLSGVEMFITTQVAYVDTAQRRLVTASAGHCPALLATADSDRVEWLAPEGMPIGILQDVKFAQQAVALGPQSRVLLYTDGLTDARNVDGEFFGQRRLCDWLHNSLTMRKSAEDLKELLVRETNQWQGETDQKDDQAFVILAEE